MWNINAPQGRIPCALFTEFAEFVPRFYDALDVKLSLDLLKGLWSYGGFKLTEGPSSMPNFTPSVQRVAPVGRKTSKSASE